MAQNFSPSYTTAMLLLRQLADRPDLVQGVSAQNLKILGHSLFFGPHHSAVFIVRPWNQYFSSLWILLLCPDIRLLSSM